MTTLATCSFAAWRPEWGQPVSIALAPPKDMPEAADWPVCWLLTPRWSYFRASYAEFDSAYIAQLQRFGTRKIARTLAMISRQCGRPDRMVLVCHEPAEVAETGCHRRLAAAYWLTETGEPWPEITTEEKS